MQRSGHITRSGSLVLFLGLMLVVGAGCKRNTGPKAMPRKAPGGSGSGGEAPATEAEGTGGGTGTGTIQTFESEDDERAKAMEEAYGSLVVGDSLGPKRLLELGADTMTVLERAIRSENINAMVGACRVLEQLADEPKAQELLGAALDHPAIRVRSAALDAVAATHLVGLREQVRGMLTDDELEIRATACDTLAALGVAQEDLEALYGRLRDTEDVVRAACSAAFANKARGGKWESRVASLLLDKSADAKQGALRVMSLWRTPTAFDLIRGRLADPNAVVVSAAIAALAPFGDGPTVRELRGFVEDPRLGVRIEGVAALESLPKADVRQLVYEALKDREPAVRVEASSQLVRYSSDPETRIRLHALLRDESAAVRDATVLALLDLKDPRSFKAVLARFDEETDAMVLADLVDTLAACDAAAAVPYLIDRMDKAPGPELTRIVIHLRTITGQDLPVEAKQWHAWYQKAHPEPAP